MELPLPDPRDMERGFELFGFELGIILLEIEGCKGYGLTYMESFAII
jgi:hypothetical protein